MALLYFMDLAYDYETWGSSAINKTELYVTQRIHKQFQENLSERQKDQLADVLEGYTKWNTIRSPESMQVGLFDSVHFSANEEKARGGLFRIGAIIPNGFIKNGQMVY